MNIEDLMKHRKALEKSSKLRGLFCYTWLATGQTCDTCVEMFKKDRILIEEWLK